MVVEKTIKEEQTNINSSNDNYNYIAIDDTILTKFSTFGFWFESYDLREDNKKGMN